MRLAPFGIALVLAASAAQAGNVAYLDPYPQPAHGLHFADLEASISSDPRVWSSDPRWEKHSTPQDGLAGASAALSSAVPSGTSAARANDLLRKAGAHCDPVGPAELDCLYHTAQTPFGGADFDNVTWQVKLTLADGHVSDLSVARYWTRR